MKNIFLLIFLFTVFTFNSAYSQDTINWRPNYILKWEDFQGKADSSSEFGAITYAATQYSFKSSDTSFHTKVFCYFDKRVSWVRVKSDIGLIHEQGHFNIAELFARKLRKAFKSYKFNTVTVRQDLRTIFDRIVKERDLKDKLYDKETDFSRNKQAQLL